MKKLLFGLPLVLALGMPNCDPSTVIYAQSLPATIHATWTPNPASQNTTQYKLQLDAGTVAVIPLSACTATLCTATLVVPSFGNHVANVRATNLLLSTDPTSGQDSPASTVSFSLNQAPTAPAGMAVTP